MSKTPYAIVKAEIALNNMIDQAKTPGADLWLVEQQKKDFLVSLQEAIQQEVKNQVATYNAEIERAQMQIQNANFSLQNVKNVSYERIERYNTHERPQHEPGFDNFLRNVRSLPRIFAFSIVGALALNGFVSLIVR